MEMNSNYKTDISVQTGRTFVVWKTEHKHHLRLGDRYKSTIALHRWNMGLTINFNKTTVLNASSNWKEKMVYESMEIQLHTGTINEEDGIAFSKAWLPAYTL